MKKILLPIISAILCALAVAPAKPKMKIDNLAVMIAKRRKQRLICLSVLVGVLLTIGFSARAETVTGTFRYRDSDGTLRPIISTRVEIWRHAPRFLGIWAWGGDAIVATNSNGSISVNMPFVASGVTYQVRVYATNAGAVVHQIQNFTADFYDVPSISFVANSPSNVFDFSFNFVDPYSAQHYNLADTVLLGFNYASTHRDPRETDPLPPVLVQPSTTLPTGTFYNPVNDAVMIDSSDVFNDYVILHEYTHYLEDRISGFAAVPSVHDGCFARDVFGGTINSAEHAWMEGFADYFAMMVASLQPPGRLTFTAGRSGLGTTFADTLERQPGACAAIGVSTTGGVTVTPDMVEDRVAGSLWDIFDQPGDANGTPGSGGGSALGSVIETHDWVSRLDTQIFQIFDRELGAGGRLPTITDFYNAWIARGLPAGGLEQILRRHQILPSSSPIGWLDSIDSNGNALGWTLDPDRGSQAIAVHFYVDGPAGGGGTFAGQTTANLSRPDVNQVTGYIGNHGFSFTVPAQYKDGLNHTLYVYGIDATGNPNAPLSGVPRVFYIPSKLALQNGWTNAPYGTRNAEATVVSGIVYLHGAISNGTSPVAFTLPTALRPATNVYVPVDLCNATKGRLFIQPSGVVSIEAEGGAFANAQCFTSLEGASFAPSAVGFTALALANGWTHSPYGTSSASALKIDGIVHLKGAIAGGTSPVIATLASDLRPATWVYVPVDLCNAAKGRLVIQPSGVVSVQAEGGFSNAQCFTSLDGVSFAQDATAFTTLSLANGWTHAPYGTRSAAVKNLGGVVQFEGAIAGGTNSVAFTLPTALRPATNVYVPVDLCNATKGRLFIQPSGVVSIEAKGGAFANAQCFTSLEGATFVVDW
jgi:hypothetical protein